MDDTRQSDLTTRLFALLTMKCEDGAADAVKGQKRGADPLELAALANHLQSTGEEIALIAQAARALL